MVKFTNFQKNKLGLVLIIIILLSSFSFAQGTQINPGHPVSQLDCGSGTESDPYKKCDSNNNGILDTTENSIVAYALNLTPPGAGLDVSLKTKFVDSSRLSVPTDLSNNYLVGFSGTGGSAQHIKVGYADVAGSLAAGDFLDDIMLKSKYDRINTGDGVVDTAEMIRNESGGFGILRLSDGSSFGSLSDYYLVQRIAETGTVTLKKLKAGYADEALKSSGSFTVTGPYLIFNVPDTGNKYSTNPSGANNIALGAGVAWDDSRGSIRGERECDPPSATCIEPLLGSRLVINPEDQFTKGVQIGWPRGNAMINNVNAPGDLYVAGNLEVDGSSWLGDEIAVDKLNVTGEFNLGGEFLLEGDLDLNAHNILDAGKIGIGTSNLNKKLTIVNNEDTSSLKLGQAVTGIELINIANTPVPSRQVDISFSANEDTSGAGRYATISGIVTESSSLNTGGSLLFSTKRSAEALLTQRMVIDNKGNIGIGDFSSGAVGAKLDVNGNVRINDELNITKNVNINGQLCFIQDVGGVPTPVCEESWDSIGNIRGSGSAGQIAMFKSPDEIDNSIIKQSDDGSEYTIEMVDTFTQPIPKKVNLDISGNLLVGGSIATGDGSTFALIGDGSGGNSDNYVVDIDNKKLRVGYADISGGAIESFLISKSTLSPELKFKVFEETPGPDQLVDKSAIYAEDVDYNQNPPIGIGRLIINKDGLTGDGFPGGVQVVGNLEVTGKITGDGSGLTGASAGWTADTIVPGNEKTITSYNVGIGTNDPGAKLGVAGAIKSSGAEDSTTKSATLLFKNTNEFGIPTGDGFRLRYDSDFFGTSNLDALIIEKTDGNENDPDGGIVFVNTGSDGIEDPALRIRGNGNVIVGRTLMVYGDTFLGASNGYNITKINSFLQLKEVVENMVPAPPGLTCNSAGKGRLRYEAVSGLQVCDGARWQSVVNRIIAGNGLIGNAEIGVVTLDVNTGTEATTGLKTANDLIQLMDTGCVAGEIIKRNTANNGWECVLDSGITSIAAGTGIAVTGGTTVGLKEGSGSTLTTCTGSNQKLIWDDSTNGRLTCAIDNTGTSYWTQTGNNISYSTGNVGIGTSDPSKKLTISGNENTISLGYGGALTGIDLINTATTSLPSRQVDIGFRGSHPSSEGRYAAITGVVTGSSASGQIGSLIFSTKASVSDTSLTERMIITNAGNVGIGTLTPAVALHVMKDFGLPDSPAGGNLISVFGEDQSNPIVGIGYMSTGGTPTGAIVRASSNLPLYLGTSSFPKTITIANDGKVIFGGQLLVGSEIISTRPTISSDAPDILTTKGYVDSVAGGIFGPFIDSSEITDGTIANVDINAVAAIAGTKISPNFGSQNILTTGTATATQFCIGPDCKDSTEWANMGGSFGTSIDSNEITDGTIANVDINAAAAIATSKISGLVTSISGNGLGALATKDAVATSEITDGTIANVDINAAAAIVGTKISPNFGSQPIITTGAISGGSVVATNGINGNGLRISATAGTPGAGWADVDKLHVMNTGDISGSNAVIDGTITVGGLKLGGSTGSKLSWNGNYLNKDNSNNVKVSYADSAGAISSSSCRLSQNAELGCGTSCGPSPISTDCDTTTEIAVGGGGACMGGNGNAIITNTPISSVGIGMKGWTIGCLYNNQEKSVYAICCKIV